jgi:hypothetical protein
MVAGFPSSQLLHGVAGIFHALSVPIGHTGVIVQLFLHASLLFVFPSSHCSLPFCIPSPHRSIYIFRHSLSTSTEFDEPARLIDSEVCDHHIGK